MKKFSLALFFNGLFFGLFYGLLVFLPLETKMDLIAMLPDDIGLNIALWLAQLAVWAFPMFLINIQILSIGMFGLMAKYGILD